MIKIELFSNELLNDKNRIISEIETPKMINSFL